MRRSSDIPDEGLSNAVRPVLALLSQMKVVPVLIGGCALAARGVSVETSDIDLLVDCDQSKLCEVAGRAKAAGHGLDALSEQALRDGVSAELRIFPGGVQADLIPISNVREQHVHARATMESWIGTTLLIARLVDVLVEKFRTGRTAGLEHIGSLVKVRLSGYERHKALQDCHDLGLMTRHGTMIRDIFGD